MSRKSRARARLGAIRASAWVEAPRELSRYGGGLALCGGAIFCLRAKRTLDTARTEVVTVDSLGPSAYGARGPLAQAAGEDARIVATVDAAFALFLIVVGLVALLSKRG